MVEGGKPFTGTLAHPPTNNGAVSESACGGACAFSEPQFYADSAVVAYRAPAEQMCRAQPKITWSSGGTIDAACSSMATW